MAQTAEILSFPGVNLNDIPASLRRMADQVEAGAHGEVSELLIVMPMQGDWPAVFGFGPETSSNMAVIGQLEAAKAWFLKYIAEDD